MDVFIGTQNGIIVEMVLVRFVGPDKFARSTRRGVSDMIEDGLKVRYVKGGAPTLRLGAKYSV